MELTYAWSFVLNGNALEITDAANGIFYSFTATSINLAEFGDGIVRFTVSGTNTILDIHYSEDTTFASASAADLITNIDSLTGSVPVSVTNITNNTFLSPAIVDITWASLKFLKDNDGLTKGMTYKITDRFNYQAGGSGVIPNQSFTGRDRGLVTIQALDINVLSKDVTRIMAVPAFYEIGTDGFANDWIGVWNDTKTVIIGNFTIFGGRVYANLSGNIGTNLDDIELDGEWTYVSIISSKGAETYTDIQFNAIYDFDNDWFENQKDGRGNMVGMEYGYATGAFGFTYNPCDITDWNFIAGPNRSTPGSSSFNNNNVPGGIYNNSGIYIENNRMASSGYVIKNNSADEITTCTSSVTDSHCSSITFCTIDIYGIPNTVDFVRANQIFNAAGTGSLPARYEIDITGTNLLALGAESQFVNEAYLISSNPTETIDFIINMAYFDQIGNSGRRLRIYVEPGLTVTFTHAGVVDGSSLNLSGATNKVVNGTKGEWIEFMVKFDVAFPIISQYAIGQY